ncbi:MAG: EamA family transporter RarD [Eggerthellaceae bacterium]|nr:EamA family transporter RarD [Eggerthellaceae bacterium]
MTEQPDIAQQRRGIAAGIACYVLWGTFPLYWKLLDSVSPLEVIAHRIIWCFATTVLVCAVARLDLPGLLRQPRAWKFLVPAALFITLNWSVYIYAVDIDHVVETAIGYYINPLVSILLGVVVFRERLSRVRVAALALCAVGVVFFTVNYGQFPWIALVLAFSFGIYGALKKAAGYPATTALAFESTVMVVPSIVFAVVLANVTGEHTFGSDPALTALLVLAGPATAIPLILFARAANAIPLSLLGFIQYLSPTIALLTGVFLFGEPFTVAHAVCLGCIWAGLALVTFETLRRPR